MFGLFKSAPTGVTVVDKVWMSKAAKLNACAEMLRLNPNCLLIAWFEETYLDIQKALNLNEDHSTLILADHAQATNVSDRMIIFVEHHPLRDIEQDLFKRLNLREAPVLCSLDEPFFLLFGGEKTADLMRKLGMKDDEVVGHSMVTKSIQRAQEKIATAVKINKPARSQSEWFTINLK